MSDSKFSIVVPTMWRYAPFVDFLAKLVEVDVIGEIVIINNAVDETPDTSVLTHPKIKMHNFKLNILVNPAWNYGAGVSAYNKLCIMNDDVEFDLALFDRLFTELTVGKFIVNAPKPPDSDREVTGNIEILPALERPWEFGSLMFIHKDDWVDIPAGLDYFHGDTWLWYTMILRYKQNYMIRDLNFFTPRGVTSYTISNREFIYVERECKLYVVAIEMFKRRLGLL